MQQQREQNPPRRGNQPGITAPHRRSTNSIVPTHTTMLETAMSAVRGILELFRATKPNSTSSTPYATSSGNAMEASAANAMPPAGTNKVGEPPTTLHPRNSPNPSVIKARRGISAWCKHRVPGRLLRLSLCTPFRFLWTRHC